MSTSKPARSLIHARRSLVALIQARSGSAPVIRPNGAGAAARPRSTRPDGTDTVASVKIAHPEKPTEPLRYTLTFVCDGHVAMDLELKKIAVTVSLSDAVDIIHQIEAVIRTVSAARVV